MTKEQNKLYEYADKIIDMFNGENSGLCIAAMIVAIEEIATCEESTKDFKQETIEFLRGSIIYLDRDKETIKPQISLN